MSQSSASWTIAIRLDNENVSFLQSLKEVVLVVIVLLLLYAFIDVGSLKACWYVGPRPRVILSCLTSRLCSI